LHLDGGRDRLPGAEAPGLHFARRIWWPHGVIASSPLTMARVIETATGPLGAEWAAMTFPSFRPHLDVLGGVNPATGGRPVAVLAAEAGEPVGLALAEIAPDGTPAAELLSLYVAQPARGQGLATMLVERLEGELRSQHVARLEAVYMTD